MGTHRERRNAVRMLLQLSGGKKMSLELKISGSRYIKRRQI